MSNVIKFPFSTMQVSKESCFFGKKGPFRERFLTYEYTGLTNPSRGFILMDDLRSDVAWVEVYALLKQFQSSGGVVRRGLLFMSEDESVAYQISLAGDLLVFPHDEMTP